MAANFNNSFTGKGIYQPLPSGENLQRAGERASDLILQAQKLKYDTFKKNEEEFLKTANIDPVFVLSQASRETQQRLLDQFNTNWGKKFQLYGGNLPTEEKVKMAKEKDFLMMEQAKMKGDMERAVTDRSIIAKDVRGEIDHTLWKEKWDNYMKTGEYDESPLLPAEVDPALFFNNYSNKLHGTKSTISEKAPGEGGQMVEEVQETSGTREEADEHIRASIAKNDGLARNVIKQFTDLKTSDPKKYQEYLNSSDNPVLKFAQDKYWKNTLVLGEKKRTTPPPATPSTKGKLSEEIKIGTGQTIKYEPPTAGRGVFGNRNYDSYYQITEWPTQNINVPGATILEEDGTRTPVKTTVAVRLTGYDANTDEFTFIAESNYDGNYGKGNNIAMKGSEVPAEFNNIKVVYKGKPTTIAEIKASQGASAQTTQTETPAQKAMREAKERLNKPQGR
jgi:hypothetical protein